jgi:DNA-binding beta-propeller fold protein YncE
MWIADCYTQSVTKIRTSDGATIGNFPVGGCAYALTFDGDHIWVGNLNGTINKLAASDGRNLETIPGPYGLEDIIFDGANIWTTTADSNLVSKH